AVASFQQAYQECTLPIENIDEWESNCGDEYGRLYDRAQSRNEYSDLFDHWRLIGLGLAAGGLALHLLPWVFKRRF
ncbi:MAG: hypothetical protein V7754_14855, partial [Halioglobus sp.]